jgi:hypothetical protein
MAQEEAAAFSRKEAVIMKTKALPIDLTKHKVYSRNAEKCVRKLLRRYYDERRQMSSGKKCSFNIANI